jgi:spore coat protein U-like protein
LEVQFYESACKNFEAIGFLDVLFGAMPVRDSRISSDRNRLVQRSPSVQAECRVNAATEMDFGTTGVIAANIDVKTLLSIQCTNGTAYNVGLNNGTGSGATVSNRQMTGPGGATVSYNLYQDVARTQEWGTTVGTNTRTGTGNGWIQTLLVYGRVAPQTTPAPGVYTDTITVTVTF